MIRVLWILLFVASSVLWARDIDESASLSTEDVSSSSGPQELDVQISKSGFRRRCRTLVLKPPVMFKILNTSPLCWSKSPF